MSKIIPEIGRVYKIKKNAGSIEIPFVNDNNSRTDEFTKFCDDLSGDVIECTNIEISDEINNTSAFSHPRSNYIIFNELIEHEVTKETHPEYYL